MGKYLEIRVHEGDRKGWFGKLTYEALVQYLWKSGAPGVTVFRGNEGLDAEGHFQNVYNEYASDKLPITLQVYGDEHEIDHIMEGLEERIPRNGQVFVTGNVYSAKQLEGGQIMGDGTVLKVYMKEEDEYEKKPLYHALVLAFKELDVLWVSVQSAMEGFGADHVIRKSAVFEFASHAPVLVEVALEADKVDMVLQHIQPLLACASGPAIILRGEVVAIKPDDHKKD